MGIRPKTGKAGETLTSSELFERVEVQENGTLGQGMSMTVQWTWKSHLSLFLGVIRRWVDIWVNVILKVEGRVGTLRCQVDLMSPGWFE